MQELHSCKSFHVIVGTKDVGQLSPGEKKNWLLKVF